MLFAHENNIKTKINSNYNGIGEIIDGFYNTEYLPVQESLMKIDFTKGMESFVKATDIIQEYLNKLSVFSQNYEIDDHSKFRSSFLEEISTYLFKDNGYIQSEILGVYNKGIYAGLKIDTNMDVRILKKDVDFCIGKKCEIKIDDMSVGSIIIPIVAVEVKTYLDGTMFGEAEYSSQLIKNATPNARTYVLMEYNKLGKDKIMAARYDNVLNEMFVLKENKNSVLDAKVLMDYYTEIENVINRIDNQDTVVVPGRLINVE